jgi:hypothetical protein
VTANDRPLAPLVGGNRLRHPTGDDMYYFKTILGTFWIRPHVEFPDRVRLGVDETVLASFHSPAAAAETVQQRQTGWAEWDDRSDLEAPDDLSAWAQGEPDR